MTTTLWAYLQIQLSHIPGFINYARQSLSRGLITLIICHTYIAFPCLCLSSHAVPKYTSYNHVRANENYYGWAQYGAVLLVNQTRLYGSKEYRHSIDGLV